jgi:hypothetical protein
VRATVTGRVKRIGTEKNSGAMVPPTLATKKMEMQTNQQVPVDMDIGNTTIILRSESDKGARTQVWFGSLE